MTSSSETIEQSIRIITVIITIIHKFIKKSYTTPNRQNAGHYMSRSGSKECTQNNGAQFFPPRATNSGLEATT